jgi:hypothetical protein
MNWFKRTFGKRNWITVYTCMGKAKREDFYGDFERVDVRFFIQVDKERNTHRCFYTDGQLKTNMNISYFAADKPDVQSVLKAYNINF